MVGSLPMPDQALVVDGDQSDRSENWPAAGGRCFGRRKEENEEDQGSDEVQPGCQRNPGATAPESPDRRGHAQTTRRPSNDGPERVLGQTAGAAVLGASAL
jgi:hypothetical protein